MSILRSYIDKNNTIVSNSFVNTGRNPVIELNFGASDLIVPNYGYSRLLFNRCNINRMYISNDSHTKDD
jgi:hypothetical protein